LVLFSVFPLQYKTDLLDWDDHLIEGTFDLGLLAEA
jgi:hypothetical protein